MLPSSKRPPRNTEEVIRTGDYEVIHAAPGSKAKPRVTERPRPMQASVNDEDQTLLFSGSTRSILPPRPGTPVPTPSMRAPRAADISLRGLVREGREKPAVQEKTNLRGSMRQRPDNEDRTILRPTSTIPPAGKLASSPPSLCPGVRPRCCRPPTSPSSRAWPP